LAERKVCSSLVGMEKIVLGDMSIPLIEGGDMSIPLIEGVRPSYCHSKICKETQKSSMMVLLTSIPMDSLLRVGRDTAHGIC
jgi:hypothetical protein